MTSKDALYTILNYLQNNNFLVQSRLDGIGEHEQYLLSAIESAAKETKLNTIKYFESIVQTLNKSIEELKNG